jgi:AraC-like DNA-binding protein
VCDALYGYYRGAAGFALVMAGVTFLVARGADKAHRSLGSFFLAIGALFSLSALDPTVKIPADISNLLIVGFIYVLSISLLDLFVFLFGNEKRRGGARGARAVGGVVSAALVLVPLLDYALGGAPVRTSIEDGQALGLLHLIAGVAIYGLPIASCLYAFSIARWSPSDVSMTYPDTRIMLVGVAAAALLLLSTLTAVILGSRTLYRLSHVALQTLMLVWYLYIIRHPDSFARIRRQIGRQHTQRFTLSDQEAALIDRRLSAIAAGADVILDDSFNLNALAVKAGVPAYRLSYFFSTRLKTTFPAWRNALRMEYVRRRMAERPDLSILEIAHDAGYASKAAFNAQFHRANGMNPSDYRRGLKKLLKGTNS